jgi:hypothetical protein
MTSWNHPGFVFVFGWKGLEVGHEASGDGPSAGRGGGDLKWMSLYESVISVRNFFMSLPRRASLLLKIPD